MYFRSLGRALPAPTLVCIPGLLGGPSDFDGVIELLGDRFHIIVQDPNFVRRETEGLQLSSESMQELSFQSSASDIAELLRGQGIAAAFFLGFSIGGKIIYDFASQFPEMVLGAVITDVSLEPFSESDLFKFVQDVVDATPLHLPWPELKKYFADTLSDRNLRSLIQTQISYPAQKPPAIWKTGMANLEDTLKRQSLNSQFEAFQQVDGGLARAGHQLVILKSSSHSGISALAADRLRELQSVRLTEVESASHFLHITHKDRIVSELVALATKHLV